MAKKTKKKSSAGVLTGFDLRDLERELKNSGKGSGDRDSLFIPDGGLAEVSFVSQPNEWVRFHEAWDGKSYYIVEGEMDDDGRKPSVRLLVAVYVNRIQFPATSKYEARKEKDLGYRFIKLNAETAEHLLKILKRRGKLTDITYEIERDGEGTRTKYHIQRGEHKIKKDHLAGWKGKPGEGKGNLILAKYKQMLKEQNSKGKDDDDDDDDDDDFDLDDSYLDDLMDDDDDDDRKSKKKSKKSSKKKRR